jgi:hypothetical protein
MTEGRMLMDLVGENTHRVWKGRQPGWASPKSLKAELPLGRVCQVVEKSKHVIIRRLSKLESPLQVTAYLSAPNIDGGNPWTRQFPAM